MIGRKCKTHDRHRSLVDQALEQRRLRISQGVWSSANACLPAGVVRRAGHQPQYCVRTMRVLAFSRLIDIRQDDGGYLRSMTGLHIDLLDAVENQDPECAKSLCRQLINDP